MEICQEILPHRDGQADLFGSKSLMSWQELRARIDKISVGFSFGEFTSIRATTSSEANHQNEDLG